MNQDYKNILNLINDKSKILKNILENAKEQITMSSGSYYSDYVILEGIKLKAIFDYKGTLKELH